jgi:hypothetical protein
MKLGWIIGVLFLVVGMNGCISGVRSPVLPPIGVIFSDIGSPVDITFAGTMIGDQQGTARAYSILYLFAFGDCSVDAATRNGGIKEVHQIDCKFMNFFLFFSRYETVVTGSG